MDEQAKYPLHSAGHRPSGPLTVRNMVVIFLCVQDDMFSPASPPIPPILSSAEKKAIDNDRKENELSEKKKEKEKKEKEKKEKEKK